MWSVHFYEKVLETDGNDRTTVVMNLMHQTELLKWFIVHCMYTTHSKHTVHYVCCTLKTYLYHVHMCHLLTTDLQQKCRLASQHQGQCRRHQGAGLLWGRWQSSTACCQDPWCPRGSAEAFSWVHVLSKVIMLIISAVTHVQTSWQARLSCWDRAGGRTRAPSSQLGWIFTQNNF